MSNKSAEHINHVMNEEVSTQTTFTASIDTTDTFEIKQNQVFIEDDAFIGNPYSLLGRVVVIKKPSNEHEKKEAAFSAIPIKVEIDQASKLKQPLKTKSFIVDRTLSLNISFLNYLTTKLDKESLFSVIVFDQAVGLADIHHESYIPNIKNWLSTNEHLLKDDAIDELMVVTGVVQKNIIRKKYKRFKIGQKGGAFGLNVNGNLYMNTEDYSLDVRFGLSFQNLPKISIQKAKNGLRSEHSISSTSILADSVKLTKANRIALQSIKPTMK